MDMNLNREVRNTIISLTEFQKVEILMSVRLGAGTLDSGTSILPNMES